MELYIDGSVFLVVVQKLMGASLLILANKQDIKGAIQPEELAKVNHFPNLTCTCGFH